MLITKLMSNESSSDNSNSPQSRRHFSCPRPSLSLPNSKWIPATREKREIVSERTPANSIAPPDHRENTAMHALKDSFSLPASFSLINTFPVASLLQHPPSILSQLSDTLRRNNTNDQAITTAGIESDASAHLDSGFDKLSGNVLMMGGYRGSILRDAKTNKRVWVPLKVGIGLRKPDLRIGLTDKAEENTTDNIYPSKMLTTLAGFLDLGKSLKTKLNKLHKEKKINFINYGYDWRRNLDISSMELIRYLENVKKQTGKSTTVIAHSMGGLVVLHAIITAPDPSIFKAVVFAGTPLDGCVNVLGPLRAGGALLLNRETCNPISTFSMRSSFYMLPSNGQCFETPNGTPIPIDFFSTREWSRYAFSPVTLNILPATEQEKTIVSPMQTDKEEKEADSFENVSKDAINVEQISSKRRRMSTSSSMSSDDSAYFSFDGEAGHNKDGIPLGLRKSNISRHSSILEQATDGQSAGVAPNLTEASSLPEIMRSLLSLTTATATVDDNKTATSDDIKYYLDRTLKRVLEFRNDLREGPAGSVSMKATKAAKSEGISSSSPPCFPKVAIIASKMTATVRGAIVDSADDIIKDDYGRQLFAEGDGIVTYKSATALPPSWNEYFQGVVHSRFGHVSLLADLKSVNQALDRVL